MKSPGGLILAYIPPSIPSNSRSDSPPNGEPLKPRSGPRIGWRRVRPGPKPKRGDGYTVLGAIFGTAAGIYFGLQIPQLFLLILPLGIVGGVYLGAYVGKIISAGKPPGPDDQGPLT